MMRKWRARLGLIIPSSNAVMEPEFYAMAPEGVTVHTTRLYLKELSLKGLASMAEDIEETTTLLDTASVDVIAYGCVRGSMHGGPEGNDKIISKMRNKTKVPVFTTSTAVVAALRELQVKNVSVATPHPDDENECIRKFLEHFGFNVVAIKGLRLEDYGLKTGKRGEYGKLPADVAYEQAKAVNSRDADAVFLSCTGFRTISMLDLLETDLGKPVVSSNQATFWLMLRTIRINEPIAGYGRLLMTPPRIAA